MHALVLRCINQLTKFEVPSLTIPKIWSRQNFKRPHQLGG